jgi:tetratricopeptide (TPR) repeat protein
VARQETGDAPGAAAAWEEAVRLDPEFTPALDHLARQLAVGPDGSRDGKRAVGHAARACELTGWKRPGYLDTLAAAYAEAGDFDKAVEFQKKALSIGEFEGQLGAEARTRLDLYTRKAPYRQPPLRSEK